MKTRNEIGLAVIGCGRIGTLRSRLAAMHPSVRFIGVMDSDQAAAGKLARTVDAGFCTTDMDVLLAHGQVNAVIVSSSEGEHAAPVLAALRRGLPVLVEKPIALTVPEADLMLRTVRELGGNLRVRASSPRAAPPPTHRFHPQRDREVGPGGQGGRHRAGVRPPRALQRTWSRT